MQQRYDQFEKHIMLYKQQKLIVQLLQLEKGRMTLIYESCLVQEKWNQLDYGARSKLKTVQIQVTKTNRAIKWIKYHSNGKTILSNQNLNTIWKLQQQK